MNSTQIRKSEIVKCSEVVVGDWITEYDTPEGPFYLVAKVNAKSLVVHLDPNEPDTIRLPFTPSDIVRREV
jgi:hypothetical protein